MKRKIVSCIVCFAMVFSSIPAAFAQTPDINTLQTEEKQGTSVYTLSLEDAINMALEKDPAFMSADVKITDAERQLKQARKNHKDMQGVPIRVTQGISAFGVQRGYYVKQAEIGVESAKREKEQSIANSAYSLTEQYYGVKLSERVLESAKTALKMAEDNLSDLEMQFSMGLVAENDVENAKLSVKRAQAACNQSERNLNLAKKALAVSLYIEDEEFELVLTDDIEYEEFTADLSEDTKKAMETRYDVFMLDSALSQAEFLFDISDLFGTTSAEYSSAKAAMIQSEVTSKYSKKMIGISINSSYNSILDAKDSLLIAEDNLFLKQKEHSVAKIQYELGLITNTQLTAIMNNVTTAQIELDNAKLAHKLAVIKYGYEITIGL